MRLKRRRGPEILPEHLYIGVAVFLTLEDSMERYAELSARKDAGASADELRPEALKAAREIAYCMRKSWNGITAMARRGIVFPAELSPTPALRVLARLSYALVALSEDDPVPDTLISPAELDGLFAKHEIEDWVRWSRERRAAVEARREARRS